MTIKWILLIIAAVIFIVGAIWYAIDMKKTAQEEQDDFYNANYLKEKNNEITQENIREFSDAVVFGDFEKVKKMVKDNFEIINSQDKYGFSALHNVMSEEQFKIVEYLIKNGANVNIQNSEGISPLHLAGWPENAELLLNAGAEVDIIDHQGNTPLHIIAEEVDEELGVLVIEYLISKNANKDLKNNAGKTPLNIAIEAGNEEIIDYLNNLKPARK
ncbi:MAG: hypothetical protein COA95_04985 [Methylophaga sp.]|nr:MAG: hypothetical protein COA95_04985 [Methylophaga sp.]